MCAHTGPLAARAQLTSSEDLTGNFLPINGRLGAVILEGKTKKQERPGGEYSISLAEFKFVLKRVGCVYNVSGNCRVGISAMLK